MLKKSAINSSKMSINISTRAWAKIGQMAKVTKRDTFLLSMTSNTRDGIYYYIHPWKGEWFILKTQEKTNKMGGVTNSLIIDPILARFTNNISVDYQKTDYSKYVYESKFLFDIKHFDVGKELCVMEEEQNKYNKYLIYT